MSLSVEPLIAQPPVGRLILAPMEGVLDPLMRELLSQINPYDLCVTEFVRVIDMLLPKRSFD